MKPEINDLAIFGAGGLGREVASMVKYYNYPEKKWRLAGFFDDGVAKGTQIMQYGPVLGTIDDLNLYDRPLAVVLALGNARTLKVVRSKINNPNIWFPNLVSPDFLVTDPQSFVIGEGNIIQGHTEATVGVRIGSFNLFNGNVTLGHNVTVGDCNVFMPGARISGEVQIGDCNTFGAMSFVHQGLKIGNNVTLSPLSPLLTKPKDNSTYVGNPARLLKF